MAGIPRLAERDRKSKGTFTVEQVRQLLAAADNEWRGAIIAGFTTGARLGDVANLRWEDIDFEQGVIAFTQAKTQTQAVVGLHPDLKEWLKTQKDSPTKGPIFPSLSGRYSGGRSGLSGEFGRIMEKAGIESDKIREQHGKAQRPRADLSRFPPRRRVGHLQEQADRADAKARHGTHTRRHLEALYTHRS